MWHSTVKEWDWRKSGIRDAIVLSTTRWDGGHASCSGTTHCELLTAVQLEWDLSLGLGRYH